MNYYLMKSTCFVIADFRIIDSLYYTDYSLSVERIFFILTSIFLINVDYYS